MRMLAWDVGIVNLAFCLLQGSSAEDFVVLDWDVINLVPKGACKKVDNEALRLRLIAALDALRDRLLPEQLDAVIIENQPVLKNPVMKALAGCLFDYFLLRGKVDSSLVHQVQFSSPINKLRLGILSASETEEVRRCTKSKYLFNKKIAVLTCERILSGRAEIARINASKKRDDLADCFLLAYHLLCKSSKCPSSRSRRGTRGEAGIAAAAIQTDTTSPGATPEPPRQDEGDA